MPTEEPLQHQLSMHFLEVVLVCAFLRVPARNAVFAEKTTTPKTYFSRSNCSPRAEATSVGERATCPFTMAADVDPTRIPSELPVVKCNCLDNLCSSMGDYRCTEVRNTIHVAYREGSDGSKLRNGTVELATSCVCAVGRSASANTGGVRTQDVNRGQQI